jgi:hypothetical protein
MLVLITQEVVVFRISPQAARNLVLDLKLDTKPQAESGCTWRMARQDGNPWLQKVGGRSQFLEVLPLLWPKSSRNPARAVQGELVVRRCPAFLMQGKLSAISQNLWSPIDFPHPF